MAGHGGGHGEAAHSKSHSSVGAGRLEGHARTLGDGLLGLMPLEMGGKVASSLIGSMGLPAEGESKAAPFGH